MKLPELWISWVVGIVIGLVLLINANLSIRWSIVLGTIGGFMFGFIDRGLRGAGDHSIFNE